MKLNISVFLVVLPFILSALAIPLKVRAVARSTTRLASSDNPSVMSVSGNSLDPSVTLEGEDVSAVNSTSVDDSQNSEDDSDTSLDTGGSTDDSSDLGSDSSSKSTDVNGASTDITGNGNSTDISATTSNSTDIVGSGNITDSSGASSTDIASSGNSTDLGIFGDLLSQADPAMVSALRQAIDVLDDQWNGFAGNTTDSSSAQDGSEGGSDATGDANTAGSTDSADSADDGSESAESSNMTDDGSEDDCETSANMTAAIGSAVSSKRRSLPKIRRSFLSFDDSQ
ncbi:hypothetical protein M422DRAFT_268736 [Sphaerobolus stellatus SS14]|uniref:Uncharacterized protein n=1 Tax=Sphaerobolus stellatus (strain SS14) TaxID=990650 RepID=A0A0C9U669_SPHS4|nr:hypothetical protein M422DRAFT_268736 [Sphaerobolus stellatus SS14]